MCREASRGTRRGLEQCICRLCITDLKLKYILGEMLDRSVLEKFRTQRGMDFDLPLCELPQDPPIFRRKMILCLEVVGADAAVR